jgi:fused signal recognition particle receptor
MGLFRLFARKPAAELSVGAAPSPPGQRASRLRTALNRTRAFLTTAFATDPEGLVDDEYYEEVVDALVLADVGSDLASKLTNAIKGRMQELGLVRKADVSSAARGVLAGVLSDVREPAALDAQRLSVILLVGVNGSGKTTLAAKLAHRLKGEGRQVLLAAADTFRAAAVDQLKVWAERVGVDMVGGQEGADPASVVFDAAQAALARGAGVLLVDTAGRLQTKKNLMAELDKIDRTIEKACPGANRANLLVLDATVGQNALSQAQLFNEACRLSGVALTKLDGTAKGGAVLAVVEQLKVPVLCVGVGEGLEDLLDFEPAEFAAGLFPEEG